MPPSGVVGMETNLLSNDSGHALVAMSQGIDSDSSRKVQVPSVLNVPHVASLSLLEHWRWADIGRDHIRELLIDKTGSFGGRGRIRRGQRGFMLLELNIGAWPNEPSRSPTIMVSFTCWGRLESFSAAAADDAWRTEGPWKRGARSAVDIRLEENRNAMI
jgi:hypothetical protein